MLVLRASGTTLVLRASGTTLVLRASGTTLVLRASSDLGFVSSVQPVDADGERGERLT